MQYRKHSNKRLRAFIKFLSFLPGRLLNFWKLKNVIIFSMQVYGTSYFRDKF